MIRKDTVLCDPNYLPQDFALDLKEVEPFFVETTILNVSRADSFTSQILRKISVRSRTGRASFHYIIGAPLQRSNMCMSFLGDIRVPKHFSPYY